MMDADRAAAAIVPPEPIETVDLTMSDGATIRLRRHGVPDGPRVALSHGNGLAIQGYAPFWMLLADRYDVIIFDQRDHGMNPVHTDEGHTYDRVGQDQGEIIQGIRAHFGDKPAAGIMHSLSTLANVRYWVGFGPHDRRPWEALVLVDMPMMPPPGHRLEALHAEDMKDMGGRALRRPKTYDDPSELAAQLARRPEFRNWVPGAHELIARSTLRHDPSDGRWHLACPREFEARFFLTNIDGQYWSRLNEIDAPVYLLGADPNTDWVQAPSILTQALAEESGRPYDMLPETSHMLQVEKPAEAVALVERFLARHGLAA